VEEVNRMVLSGTPFRDAYKEVGRNIEKSEFNPDISIDHKHQGSIGNLCLEEIKKKMEIILEQFNFVAFQKALDFLIYNQKGS